MKAITVAGGSSDDPEREETAAAGTDPDNASAEAAGGTEAEATRVLKLPSPDGAEPAPAEGGSEADAAESGLSADAEPARGAKAGTNSGPEAPSAIGRKPAQGTAAPTDKAKAQSESSAEAADASGRKPARGADVAEAGHKPKAQPGAEGGTKSGREPAQGSATAGSEPTDRARIGTSADVEPVPGDRAGTDSSGQAPTRGADIAEAADKPKAQFGAETQANTERVTSASADAESALGAKAGTRSGRGATDAAGQKPAQGSATTESEHTDKAKAPSRATASPSGAADAEPEHGVKAARNTDTAEAEATRVFRRPVLPADEPKAEPGSEAAEKTQLLRMPPKPVAQRTNGDAKPSANSPEQSAAKSPVREDQPELGSKGTAAARDQGTGAATPKGRSEDTAKATGQSAEAGAGKGDDTSGNGAKRTALGADAPKGRGETRARGQDEGTSSGAAAPQRPAQGQDQAAAEGTDQDQATRKGGVTPKAPSKGQAASLSRGEGQGGSRGEGTGASPSQGNGPAGNPSRERDLGGSPSQGKGTNASPSRGDGQGGTPTQNKGKAGTPSQGKGTNATPSRSDGQGGTPTQDKGKAGTPGQGKGPGGSPSQGDGPAGSPSQREGAGTGRAGDGDSEPTRVLTRPGGTDAGSGKAGPAWARKPAAEDRDGDGGGGGESERTSQFVALKPLDAPKPASPGAPRTTQPAGPATPRTPQPAPDAPQAPQAGPLPPLDLLAELTNTVPPAETPRRTLVRRVKVWTPILLLLSGAAIGAQMLRPLPAPQLVASETSHSVDGQFSVPWPAKGQGAVRIPGSGDIGTFGEQKPVPTASVAKVMTAYVILKGHPLRKNENGPDVTVDAKAVAEGNSEHESRIVGLSAGTKFSQQDMLKMLMIPSGNNVARLLARWDTGSDSEGAFVEKMNAAARDLGMTNTTYTDPSGLDAKTVSTATDQLKLAEAVMKDEAFRAIVALPQAPIKGLPQPLINNNTLLSVSSLSVRGIKTGSSTPAGGTLMWAAYKSVGDETPLILGTLMEQRAEGPDPDATNSLALVLANSRKIIESVRGALAAAPLVRKGDVVGWVDDGLGGRTPLVATKDLNVIGVPGQQFKLTLAPGASALPHTAKAGAEVAVLTAGDGDGAKSVPVAVKGALAEPSFGSRVTRLG